MHKSYIIHTKYMLILIFTNIIWSHMMALYIDIEIGRFEKNFKMWRGVQHKSKSVFSVVF